MKYFFYLIFLLQFPLFAEHIDPLAASFEVQERKYHVDLYDFSGDYPNLEKIDIDGKRKKRVEMVLSGTYPLLEKIHFDGGFGTIKGKLTGSFPKLSNIHFICTSAMMDFDLSGKWERNCDIFIHGSTGDVHLTLPKDVGVIVTAKTGVLGKVVNDDSVTKKGFGLMTKTYVNEHYTTSPVILRIHVEVTKAKVLID